MGFVLILVAANYCQAIVCFGGLRREEGEEEREKRMKEEEGGEKGERKRREEAEGTEVTYHLNMSLAKGYYYSHSFSFHGRALSGPTGLDHRLGRTASRHAGGRRSA